MRPLCSRTSFLPRPETRIAQGPFRQNETRVFPALRKPGFTVVIWHMNWPTSSAVFAHRSTSIVPRWVWASASPGSIRVIEPSQRTCLLDSLPPSFATATPVPAHDFRAAQDKGNDGKTCSLTTATRVSTSTHNYAYAYTYIHIQLYMYTT